MKEHGVIFNGEMVRAFLEGRKTMTRRLMKPQPPAIAVSALEARDGSGEWKFFSEPLPSVRHAVTGWVKPPYRVGSLIWVRETWKKTTWEHPGAVHFAKDAGFIYAADYSALQVKGLSPWKPSIHMPKWAARIWRRVVAVRVERVREISREDAKAEGFWPSDMNGLEHYKGRGYGNAQLAFEACWKDLYPGSWDRNDWVWVYSLEEKGGGDETHLGS
jgi:hypothetical protein